MPYPHAEIDATMRALRDAFVEAEARNSWSWLADEFYHADCVYECPYGGVMPIRADGREAIRRTHYGRDMDVGSGWAGWSFPILDWAIDGDRIISHWVNRGPGARPDGSRYETHGVSFITYAGGGKFSSQYDLFDIGHQMLLCDELDAAGLLAPALRAEWVEPMKLRIAAALAGRPMPAPVH